MIRFISQVIDPGTISPAMTLWRREMLRFMRQPGWIAANLATPLLLWAVLGFGLDKTFIAAGVDAALADDAALTGTRHAGYLEYFFPGAVLMMVVSTAVFSNFSVIEDRREGFLQGVLVAPIPRLSIVMGKVLGGATLATAQGVVFLLLWPTIGSYPGWFASIVAVVIVAIISIALTALGFCFAWRMDSVGALHGVLLVFLPMWMLCGAFFPVATAPLPMKLLMYLNPLTYDYSMLAWVLRGTGGSNGQVHPAIAAPLMLLTTAAIVFLAMRFAQWPRKDGT